MALQYIRGDESKNGRRKEHLVGDDLAQMVIKCFRPSHSLLNQTVVESPGHLPSRGDWRGRRLTVSAWLRQPST